MIVYYYQQAGLSIDFLIQQYVDFLEQAHRLKSAYAHQITILVGLETELITHDDLDRLDALLSKHATRIEYIVGSIHHVNGIPIDVDHASFERALHTVNVNVDVIDVVTSEAVAEMNTHRMDAFLSSYLDAHLDLLQRFRPEIIGHLDVCRLFHPELRLAEFPHAWTKWRRNVGFAVGYGALFEVNAAAFRKGWHTAFPGEDLAAVRPPCPAIPFYLFLFYFILFTRS